MIANALMCQKGKGTVTAGLQAPSATAPQPVATFVVAVAPSLICCSSSMDSTDVFTTSWVAWYITVALQHHSKCQSLESSEVPKQHPGQWSVTCMPGLYPGPFPAYQGGLHCPSFSLTLLVGRLCLSGIVQTHCFAWLERS